VLFNVLLANTGLQSSIHVRSPKEGSTKPMLLLKSLHLSNCERLPLCLLNWRPRTPVRNVGGWSLTRRNGLGWLLLVSVRKGKCKKERLCLVQFLTV